MTCAATRIKEAKMLDFDRYVMNHGEGWVQEIVEQQERFSGIRAAIGQSLEERWDYVMNATPVEMQAA